MGKAKYETAANILKRMANNGYAVGEVRDGDYVSLVKTEAGLVEWAGGNKELKEILDEIRADKKDMIGVIFAVFGTPTMRLYTWDGDEKMKLHMEHCKLEE